MKPSNEFCISFLKGSGWLDNHDEEVRADERLKVIAEISREMRLLYGNEYDKQIRAEEEDKRANLLAFICKKYNIPLMDMNCTVTEWEELKENK